MILKNGRILIDNKLVKKDIEIKDDLITRIEDFIDEDGIDLKNKYITLSFCDLHVHFREPGNIKKETIKTGSLSAAKGGYTTVFLMPNLKPCPDCVENLLFEKEIIKKNSIIESIPYASVSVKEEGKINSNIKELKEYTKYFSDDGVGVNDLNVLENAVKECSKYDLFIASHAEDSRYKTDPKGEYVAVRREIEYAKKYKTQYHFCHMSTKESFQAIRKAQKDGFKVSCEVTPHHLFLNDSNIKNTNFKMNPPLRSKENQMETIKALLDGTACCISTDHAPHTYEDKNKEYSKASNGIIGLETAAPLVYTYLVKKGLATFKDMENWLTNNARKLAGLPKEEIKVNSKANLCVLDIDNPHTYTETEILSLGHNSPFIGMSLYGFNTLTIYNGKVVYENKGE